MLVGITLGGAPSDAKVRILSLADGRKFLSLELSEGVTVNLSNYDGQAADRAIALADALYGAADKLRPAPDYHLISDFGVEQELEA